MSAPVSPRKRAPPSHELYPERRDRLMMEIIEAFDRLGKLGREITSLNKRRVAIQTRLNDPFLLESHPPGSTHHEQALRHLQTIQDDLHAKTCAVLQDADAVVERLKRLDDEHYRLMLRRIGSGWKNEPIWDVVRTLPQCQGSGEWQDCMWAERIAEDNRPPF